MGMFLGLGEGSDGFLCGEAVVDALRLDHVFPLQFAVAVALGGQLRAIPKHGHQLFDAIVTRGNLSAPAGRAPGTAALAQAAGR